MTVKLEPPDSHHLNAAQGWLGLGDVVEARAELDLVSKLFAKHPEVLELRWQICEKTGQWNECVETAQSLIKVAPKQPLGWIHRSYALHELKRTQEAYDGLETAAKMFPDIWLIPYNLACYACNLGRKVEAWEWLQEAFGLGDEKEIKSMAMEDPDLKPFRAELSKI
jgi:tetratricopeptide (TPR) repeat protein